jgi:hypothetical protein
MTIIRYRKTTNGLVAIVFSQGLSYVVMPSGVVDACKVLRQWNSAGKVWS